MGGSFWLNHPTPGNTTGGIRSKNLPGDGSPKRITNDSKRKNPPERSDKTGQVVLFSAACGYSEDKRRALPLINKPGRMRPIGGDNICPGLQEVAEISKKKKCYIP